MSAEVAGPSGMRLTDEQRLDWLQLLRTESIGPKTFRRLINLHGGAAAALDAIPGIAAQRGRKIAIASRDDCARELDVLRENGASMLALGETDYPSALRAIDAAPPLISLKGKVEILQRPMVAIIGSRNASAAGLAFTERLARDLAAAGFVIVSGLARGVDARAHRSTLGTGTVAALAGGLDRIYPREHEALAEQVAETGVLMSEMPMGWEPRGRDFPRRNRIVSGLSLGTVVIEAARNSGSLITARFAAEQGREVFAVPGSPLDPRAEGTNALLREGATLCTRAQDVIEALLPIIGKDFGPPDLMREQPVPPREPMWDEWEADDEASVPSVDQSLELDEPPQKHFAVSPARVAGPDIRAHVVELMGPSPVSVDDLVRAADLSVAEVQGTLLDLELQGCLERHPGGMVSLIQA